jgi:hypothetical protein
MTNPLTVGSSLFKALHFDCWNSLSKKDRLGVGKQLEESLLTAGWHLSGPIAVGEFGPASGRQGVLQIRDRVTALCFSVIPGGTYHPGLSEHLQPRYKELYMQMEDWKADDEREPGQEPWRPEPLERTWTFASEQPCDLRPKPAVQITPFLLASESVTGKVVGMREVIGHLDRYWESKFEKGLSDAYPVQVRWEKVAPILRHFQWSLPTTEEFEWALRGGVDSVFYWGNDFPDFILVEYIEPSGDQPQRLNAVAKARFDRSFEDLMARNFEPGRKKIWPWCNRFGLAGMLACGTWCQSLKTPKERFPLIVRGGAADCYGWQGCGEWKLLLNAAEKRLGIGSDYADHNCIRPVIRLQADSL